MKKSTLFITVILTLFSSTIIAQSFLTEVLKNKWQYFDNPTPGKSDYWDFVDGTLSQP
jgi:hypothetical protein